MAEENYCHVDEQLSTIACTIDDMNNKSNRFANIQTKTSKSVLKMNTINFYRKTIRIETPEIKRNKKPNVTQIIKTHSVFFGLNEKCVILYFQAALICQTV